MFEQVNLQAVVVGKNLLAPLALVWFFTRVEALVCCQSTTLRKALTTLCAYKRSLTRMDTVVCFQSAF